MLHSLAELNEQHNVLNTQIATIDSDIKCCIDKLTLNTLSRVKLKQNLIQHEKNIERVSNQLANPYLSDQQKNQLAQYIARLHPFIPLFREKLQKLDIANAEIEQYINQLQIQKAELKKQLKEIESQQTLRHALDILASSSPASFFEKFTTIRQLSTQGIELSPLLETPRLSTHFPNL